jgi:hypothetical protein
VVEEMAIAAGVPRPRTSTRFDPVFHENAARIAANVVRAAPIHGKTCR